MELMQSMYICKSISSYVSNCIDIIFIDMFTIITFLVENHMTDSAVLLVCIITIFRLLHITQNITNNAFGIPALWACYWHSFGYTT